MDFYEEADSRSEQHEYNQRQHNLEPSTINERWKINAYYDLHHDCPGKYIIFNHYEFDEYLELSKRDGTHEDVKRLKNTFATLGLQELDQVQQDLDCKELLHKLESISTCDTTNELGFLIIVILTHGMERAIYANDGEIDVMELWKPFLSEEGSKHYAGKPKIFIIQACQGKEADPGVGSIPGANDEKEDQFIPVFADFLMVFSSPPGYASFRSTGGSWFIQCLCDAIDTFKDQLDFESILTLTKYDIARNKISNSLDPQFHRKKQIPSVVSTFTKKLYLTPKAVKTLSQRDQRTSDTQGTSSHKAGNMHHDSESHNVMNPLMQPKASETPPKSGNSLCKQCGIERHNQRWVIGCIIVLIVLFAWYIFVRGRPDYHFHCYPPSVENFCNKKYDHLP